MLTLWLLTVGGRDGKSLWFKQTAKQGVFDREVICRARRDRGGSSWLPQQAYENRSVPEWTLLLLSSWGSTVSKSGTRRSDTAADLPPVSAHTGSRPQHKQGVWHAELGKMKCGWVMAETHFLTWQVLWHGTKSVCHSHTNKEVGKHYRKSLRADTQTGCVSTETQQSEDVMRIHTQHAPYRSVSLIKHLLVHPSTTPWKQRVQ